MSGMMIIASMVRGRWKPVCAAVVLGLVAFPKAQVAEFRAVDGQGHPKLVAGTFAAGLFQRDSNSISKYAGYQAAVLNDSRGPKPDANLPAGYQDSAGASAFNAVGAVAGDFNGDGKLDLVALGAGAWLAAGASGGVDRMTFTEALISELGGFRYPPVSRSFGRSFLPLAAAADLDGDGKADLLLAADSGLAMIPGPLISCRGLCPPLLDFSVLSLPGRPMAVEVGLLNGDTLPDIVVALAGTPSKIAVILGDSTGFPSTVNHMLTANGTLNIVPGANILANAMSGSNVPVRGDDAHGDWKTLGIMVATRDSAGYHIEVFENKLPARFEHHAYTVVATSGFTTDGWQMLGLFDSNKDGRPDVLGGKRPSRLATPAADTSGLITFLADTAGKFAGEGIASPGAGNLVFCEPILPAPSDLQLARRVLTGGWGFTGNAGGITVWEPDNQGRFRVIGSMRGGPLANVKSAYKVRWGVAWYDGLADTNPVLVYADGGASTGEPGGIGTLSVAKLLQFFGTTPTLTRPELLQQRGAPAGFPTEGLWIALPDGRIVNPLGRLHPPSPRAGIRR